MPEPRCNVCLCNRCIRLRRSQLKFGTVQTAALASKTTAGDASAGYTSKQCGTARYKCILHVSVSISQVFTYELRQQQIKGS